MNNNQTGSKNSKDSRENSSNDEPSMEQQMGLMQQMMMMQIMREKELSARMYGGNARANQNASVQSDSSQDLIGMGSSNQYGSGINGPMSFGYPQMFFPQGFGGMRSFRSLWEEPPLEPWEEPSTLEDKRKLYKCGKSFVQINELPVWPEYFLERKLKKPKKAEFEPNDSLNQKISIR